MINLSSTYSGVAENFAVVRDSLKTDLNSQYRICTNNGRRRYHLSSGESLS